ncbi:MAG TPA: PHB depolymerase family esterase [Gemmatimonadales bacterium]|nr:PHB depolymerase family esterase [Gemmatimonadales bacterium]
MVALPLLAAAAFVASTTLLDRTNGTLISSGVERRYLLFVPPTYDPSRPTPLVISLHGAAAWPAQQMHLTHWNDVAAEHGFIVVYPAARGRIWRVQHPGSDPTADVRFIGDLIDTLERTYHIDSHRIYANGFSLGGAMAFALGCRLSGRLAAVGTASAAEALPWSWCTDDRPMPFINFHGTADLVPYAGGPSPDPFNPVTFPAVRQWTAQWAGRNRCRGQGDSTLAPDVVATAYRDCADDASVVLYTVRGGGHAWPGGKALPRWPFGRTTTSIDATRIMWAFFQAHPLGPTTSGRSVPPREEH